MVFWINRALGCTLYAMAFNESPFDGTLSCALSARLDFKNSKYPDQFQALITGILQTDPQKRPSLIQIRTQLELLQQNRKGNIENV